MLCIYVQFKCNLFIHVDKCRCKGRIVSCGWSADGSKIACGSGSSHFYIYHFNTSRTDSIVVGLGTYDFSYVVIAS